MKSFAFNLLPQKSKEQVKKEDERDQSAVFTAVLPLFAVVLWFALVIFNGLVVDRVKANWETSIARKEATIQQEYGDVLRQNGELVKKTQALTNVILLDIEPERVFLLTEELFPVPEPGVSVDGYGRDRDGVFDVTIRAVDYATFARVARKFTSYDGITDVYIASATIEVSNETPDPLNPTPVASNEVLGIIKFNFATEESVPVGEDPSIVPL